MDACDIRCLRRNYANPRRPVFFAILLICVLQAAPHSLPAQTAAIPTDEASTSESAPLRILSSNVRFGTADDGPDAWDVRQTRLRDCWRQQQADLVGTQEMLPFQAEYLHQEFPEYAYIGRSRELDNQQGEQCGIFYRRSRFVELAQGHFWLSETPDQPGSSAWDSALPRMVTWTKLFDREQQKPLVLINTHFDHRGETARLESARLLYRMASRWAAEYRVIITGDFNCGEAMPPYVALLSPERSNQAEGATGLSLVDTYRYMHAERRSDEGTFNAFQGRREGPRIDWILVSPEWKIQSAEIIVSQFDGRSPSDHFPVAATIAW